MANCCICGNKIGLLDGQYNFFDSNLGNKNYKHCQKCETNMMHLKSDSFTVKEKRESIAYLEKQLNVSAEKQVQDFIRELIDRVKKQVDEKQAAEEEQEKLVVEKEEKEIWMHENFERLKKEVLLTSGYSFEGYSIIEYKGLISGEVVMGTGFLSEIDADFSDLFGTRADGFAHKMRAAKSAAQEKLLVEAVKLGGNALIGVDFDYINFSRNLIGVSANATLVKILKKDGTSN